MRLPNKYASMFVSRLKESKAPTTLKWLPRIHMTLSAADCSISTPIRTQMYSGVINANKQAACTRNRTAC